MATIGLNKRSRINRNSGFTSEIRTIIETEFYGNNVEKVESVKEAYELVEKLKGTIKTDMPIYMPKIIGLGSDAKVLVNNDGAVHGR